MLLPLFMSLFFLLTFLLMVLIYTRLHFYVLSFNNHCHLLLFTKYYKRHYLSWTCSAQSKYSLCYTTILKLIYKSRLISLKLLPLMYWLEIQDVGFPSSVAYKTPCRTSTSLTMCPLVTSMHPCIHLKRSKTKLTSRCSTTSHFYFNRVVKLWNKLPIVLSESYTKNKHDICVFLWDHFIKNFNSDIPCSYHFLCPCSSCSPFSYST